MGKRRRNFRRRDFIRTGILGSAALSLGPGRLFSSINTHSDAAEGNRSSIIEEVHPRAFKVIYEYGAEFGAIKPSGRRRKDGCL